MKSVAAQIVAFVLIVAALAYGLYRVFPSDLDLTIAAQRDTVWRTDTLWREAKAAAKAAKDSSDKADSLVIILNDSTLAVRFTPTGIATPVYVPPPVTDDLTKLRRTVAKQDAALFRADSTIKARDNLNASLTRKANQRLSLAVFAGPACSQSNCGIRVGVGLSYRIR